MAQKRMVVVNCIESKLSGLFHWHGRLLSKYPLPYFLWPLIMTAILGAGLMYLKDDSDREAAYTPEHGPAKLHRDIVTELFPMNDNGNFLPSRQSKAGYYARVIIMAKDKESSVLQDDILKEARKMHDDIVNMTVTYESEIMSQTFKYNDLCGRWNTDCIENVIFRVMDYVRSTPWYERVQLTYPFAPSPTGHPVFIGNSLGGVRIMGEDVVRSAKALQLVYYLRSSDGADAEPSKAWEKALMEYLEKYQSDKLSFTYYTSQTLDSELAKSIEGIVPRFAITFCVIIIFSVICCSSFDCVTSKPWLGLLGVLTAAMAILSAMGLLGFCKVDFINAVASMPFLILGIGVDNMFIMIAAWRRSPAYMSVEDRMAQTFKEAAMSITITSVTDVLAFCVGAISDFPGVRIFCLYTGLAIIFGYIYQITFFGACLSEFGKLEARNVHWATCKKVLAPEEAPNTLYRVFCAGGLSDSNPKASYPEHMAAKFFRKYYGPFLTKTWVKGLIVLSFLAYLGFAVWGCLKLQRGIKLKNTVPDDSYASTFLDLEEEYFTRYGIPVSVTVYQHAEYWEAEVQRNISKTLQQIEDTEFFHDRKFTQSWLQDYLLYLNQTGRRADIMGKDNFVRVLQNEFLNIPGFDRYKADIRFGNDAIIASRFLVLAENANSANTQREMMLDIRRIAETSHVPMFAYHPAFIFYDQYVEILPSTLQTMGIAAASMLLVSLLLIPHPACSIWVTFAVIFISTGVIGFMSHWGISLDAISMINLIICIGFSVDFSAHITYAFVVSREETMNKRAIDALHALGMPILQGALSTILGIVALSSSDAYTFRTFFKMNFLAIGFGAVFAVVFLPTFLTFFGPKMPDRKDSSKGSKDGDDTSEDSIMAIKLANAAPQLECEKVMYLPQISVV
ncbi:patched domain-containing protein 3-like [Ptychodera flava]|uniref:patched domain-containing protein 3-like n=1 Tax=Ptychodera flava TaxID=63121 RepID=UPI003969F46B